MDSRHLMRDEEQRLCDKVEDETWRAYLFWEIGTRRPLD
jgi:hypothetical protein